jgi:hypothetical protein
MPQSTSKTGSELFIVDNSDEDWKVHRYLHDWCQISRAIDIATGYFEIGALLALKPTEAGHSLRCNRNGMGQGRSLLHALAPCERPCGTRVRRRWAGRRTRRTTRRA